MATTARPLHRTLANLILGWKFTETACLMQSVCVWDTQHTHARTRTSAPRSKSPFLFGSLLLLTHSFHNMTPHISECRINCAPPSVYYIPDFITLTEERVLVEKVGVLNTLRTSFASLPLSIFPSPEADLVNSLLHRFWVLQSPNGFTSRTEGMRRGTPSLSAVERACD